MKRFLIFSIISLILYAFPTSSLSLMTWDIERLSLFGGFENPRIAIDENNNPGVSFIESSFRDGFKYVHKNSDGTWSSTTVDANDYPGCSQELQFNPLSGLPEISYTCCNPKILRFAQFNGTLWNINTIPLIGNPPGDETSLAYHPTTNFPAIAYDEGNGRIGFVEYNGSSWVGGRQDDLIYLSGGDFELKYLSNGNPMIAYRTTLGLLVAERVNGDWAISTVDNSPSLNRIICNQAVGLEFDSNGLPHIAYLGDSDYLKYATFDGMNWNIENTRIICFDVDFDFDVNDKPLLACDQKSGGINLVYRECNNWILNLINYYGFSISNFIVDGLGNAHISYVKQGLDITELWYYYAKGTPVSYEPDCFPWLLFYPAIIKPSN